MWYNFKKCVHDFRFFLVVIEIFEKQEKLEHCMLAETKRFVLFILQKACFSIIINVPFKKKMDVMLA